MTAKPQADYDVIAIGAGFAISSFVGGYLIAWYGYRELFLFGAGMTTIGIILFWLVFRHRLTYRERVTVTISAD